MSRERIVLASGSVRLWYLGDPEKVTVYLDDLEVAKPRPKNPHDGRYRLVLEPVE